MSTTKTITSTSRSTSTKIPESDNEDYFEMKEILESGMNPEDVPFKIKVLQNFSLLHQNYKFHQYFSTGKHYWRSVPKCWSIWWNI